MADVIKTSKPEPQRGKSAQRQPRWKFEIRRAENAYILVIGGKEYVYDDFDGLIEAFFKFNLRSIRIAVTGNPKTLTSKKERKGSAK